ncbi:MAG: metallophosphoesterase [Clostridia bacterium]|nr:metallophosphoesterase [Clostridia bacterium]
MNYIISLLSSVFRKIGSVFMSIFVALGLVAGNVVPSGNTITFKNSDDIKLSAVFLSDTHIKNDTVSVQQLELALKDIKASDERFDVFALTGDITDGGDSTSFNLAWDTVENSGLSATVLPVMGNHDVWTTYETGAKQIAEKASEYTGKDIDKPYYSYDVKGYTFIALGSDAPSDKANISSEQLSFLDSELARATKDGKPAFVICHFPLKNTHGLPDVWRAGDGDIGEQSEAVRAILVKYKNVFYINGHLHTGIYSASLENLSAENGVYSLNLPAYGQPNAKGTFKGTGIGVYMEVYDGKVIFTARNFEASQPLGGFEKAFSLK